MTTITRTSSGGVSVEIVIDDERMANIFAEIASGGPIMLAIQKCAFDIEHDAKLEAPVDTGFLANSIQAQPAQMEGTTSYADIAVFAEYGIWVEEGHAVRITKSVMGASVGAVAYTIPGKHFMRHALDANGPKLDAAIHAYLERAGL